VIAATDVVLDQGSFWALVLLSVTAAVAALAAAVTGWRAVRTTQRAIDALETAREEATASQQEWLERTAVPTPEPPPPDELPPAPPPSRYRIEVREPQEPRRPPPPDIPADIPADIIPPDPRSSLPPEPTVPEAPPIPPRAAPPEGRRPGQVTEPAPPAPGPIGASEPPPAESPAGPAPMTVPPPVPEPAPEVDPVAARLLRLEHPDPFVRIEAIEGLRGHPSLMSVLTRALSDDYPLVRRQAVRALREAGGPDATRILIEVANGDTSAEVREEAVSALAMMLREARSGNG